VTIDEARKIFDRLSDFRPAFDDTKQLKDLEHPIVAMSATLTDEQIEALKQQYLRNTHDCVVLTAGVHRNNLEICLHRYKRRQFQKIPDDSGGDDDDANIDVAAESTTTSLWGDTVHKIRPLIENQSTVVYLDFVKDVLEVSDTLSKDGIKVEKYTGKLKDKERKLADTRFL